MGSVVKCPICGKLIALVFPLHDCTPTEKNMIRENMSLATIAGLWAQEKPLYAQKVIDGRIVRNKIYGLRMKRGGKIEAKLSAGGCWQEIRRIDILYVP